MTAYYNEIDPAAAQWLRNLIEAGHIAPGYVVKSTHRNTLAFGFDSLMNGGTSRNSVRNAAFLIQPPVLAARMGGRKPCRLASAVPGLSTRPSRRPHLTVGAPVLNQNWTEDADMALTEIKRFKGAKNKHPTTLCKCDCGGERLVRTTRFKLGLVTMCAACARADGAKRGAEARRKLSDDERVTNDRYSIYKQNAKKRGIVFDIALPLFSSLLDKACTYCGTHERIGVDRVDSSLGYSAENCVPCCSDCNYAKRDMSQESFLNLVARIYAHQSR